MSVDEATRQQWQLAMDRQLEQGFPQLLAGDARVAVYWPHRGEYDPRPLASRLRARGAQILLPVVLAPATAMIFRAWNADTLLAHGPHGIAEPAAGDPVQPTVILAPAVGFDAAGYRLGYGGGYFDRTLAALLPRPPVIACAHELARMPSLYPQAHDIPMDYVVTEAGTYRRVEGGLIELS
jgi:5,10-methenyltetrahydrofolate synthetase